jgi:hypothetical protein
MGYCAELNAGNGIGHFDNMPSMHKFTIHCKKVFGPTTLSGAGTSARATSCITAALHANPDSESLKGGGGYMISFSCLFRPVGFFPFSAVCLHSRFPLLGGFHCVFL